MVVPLSFVVEHWQVPHAELLELQVWTPLPPPAQAQV